MTLASGVLTLSNKVPISFAMLASLHSDAFAASTALTLIGCGTVEDPSNPEALAVCTATRVSP